jgi:DNA-binding NtrC family response regulator
VRVPPLRERGTDVLLLARHYAARCAREEGCEPVHFTPAAEEILLGYPWPGNVRELRNLLERLTILNAGRSIGPTDLPAEMTAAAPARVPPAEGRSIGSELADAERRLLENALRQADGHRGRAATILGISRHALKRRMHRLGIR